MNGRRDENIAELDALRDEMQKDHVREVLSTAAGRWFVGSIFAASRRDADSFVAGSPDITAYYCGMQRVATIIADTIRDVDPRLVADCEIAYDEFEKMFEYEDDTEDGE